MHEIQFDSLPSVHAAQVFRLAMVSDGAGRRAMRELADSGCIAPMRTPTGRVILTAADARLLFESMQGSSRPS